MPNIIEKILKTKNLSESISCTPATTSSFIKNLGIKCNEMFEDEEKKNTEVVTPVENNSVAPTEEKKEEGAPVVETVVVEEPKKEGEVITPAVTTETPAPVVENTVTPSVEEVLNEKDAALAKEMEEKFKDINSGRIPRLRNFDFTTDAFDVEFDKYVRNFKTPKGVSIISLFTNNKLTRFTLKVSIRAVLMQLAEVGHIPVDFFKSPFLKMKKLIEPLYFSKNENFSHYPAPKGTFLASFQLDNLSFILGQGVDDTRDGALDEFLFLSEGNWYYPNGLFVELCRIMANRLRADASKLNADNKGEVPMENKDQVNELFIEVDGKKIPYGSNKHLRNTYTLNDPDCFDTRSGKMFGELTTVLKEAFTEMGNKLQNAKVFENNDEYVVVLDGENAEDMKDMTPVGSIYVDENNVYLAEAVTKTENMIKAKTVAELTHLIPKDKIEGSEIYKDSKSGEFVAIIPTNIEQYYDADDIEFVGILFTDEDGIFLETGEGDPDSISDDDDVMDFEESHYEHGEDEMNETSYKKKKVVKGGKIIVKKVPIGKPHQTAAQKNARKRNAMKARKFSHRAQAKKKFMKSLRIHRQRLNHSVETGIAPAINEAQQAQEFLKKTLTSLNAPKYVFEYLENNKINLVERWVELNS